MFDVAEDIVRSGLGISDNAALADIVITIFDVRSGSIIIDYALTSNSEESLSISPIHFCFVVYVVYLYRVWNFQIKCGDLEYEFIDWR